MPTPNSGVATGEWRKMPLLYKNITKLAGGPYIRLLHLHPGQKNDLGVLQAELRVVKIQHPPPFEALSYVWGSKTTRGQICVDGEPSDKATDNLVTALGHLRHRDRTRVLWVDALCINQADADEMTEQVSIMRTIYASADTVHIWLGAPSPASEDAFDTIDSLIAAFRNDAHPFSQSSIVAACRDVGIDGDSVVRLAKQHDFEGGEVAPIEDDFLFFATDIMDLLARDWWSRTWVIQELCHARTATMRCGDRSVAWELFAFVAICMFHERASGAITGHFNLNVARCYSLARMRHRIASAGQDMTSRPDMLEALASFRWCKATRPVDRVYGLLGQVEKAGIVPDYTLDAETCYTAAAREILSRIRTLDLLDFVAPPVPLDRVWRRPMPSWAPDWSMYDRAGSRAEALEASIVSICSRLGVGQSDPPLPMGESQPRFQGDILILQGVGLDEVAAVGEPISGQRDWVIPLATFSSSIPLHDISWKFLLFFLLQGLKGVLNFLLVETRQCIDNFWAMVAMAEAAISSQSKHDAERAESVARLFRLLLHSVDDGRANPLAWPFLRDWDALEAGRWFRYCKSRRLRSLALLFWSEPTAHCGELLTINAGLRLATTRDRRLCLLPSTCRVGDQIVLLRGGRYPFVIRDGEVRGQRIIVGVCYFSREQMVSIREIWSTCEVEEMAFA